MERKGKMGEREGKKEEEKGFHTVCPRSSDPFYIVTHYVNWVTTSWAYSMFNTYDLLASQFFVV